MENALVNFFKNFTVQVIPNKEMRMQKKLKKTSQTIGIPFNLYLWILCLVFQKLDRAEVNI